MTRGLSGFTIRAFVGFNGNGKDLAAIESLVIPALQRRYPVVSNVTIRTELLGLPRDEFFVPLRSWRQLPLVGVHRDDPSRSITGNRPCVVLLSEATACLPARFFQDTPAELLRTLDQLRKLDAIAGITAPNWHKIEKHLRGCIQAVTVCEGGSPDRWVRDTSRPRRSGVAGFVAPGYPVARDERRRRRRYEGLWLPNRRFVFSTYSAQQFEEWTNDMQQRVEPSSVVRYDRRRHMAQELYDSSEQVHLLDFVHQGQCVHCGKAVRKTFCDGNHDQALKPGRGRQPVVAA